MIDEILRLKKERNAVILAHNYQLPEVQDIADFVGDSLGLSQQASKTKADVIVFCGVHFMAETAKIICPEKTVLIPDTKAGCSLADEITATQLRKWKAQHLGAVVVSYVNTTAEVKAESDYCCTSSNAVRVVESIPKDKEILFLPDMFLGAYVKEQTQRDIHIWPGECHVHAKFSPKDITDSIARHPKAELLVHPECGCTTNCLYLSKTFPVKMHILSTEGMVRRARESPSKEFVIATENGIMHRMKKESTDKKFYPVSEDAVCKYMKMTTLEKVRDSLKNMAHEVTVPEDIAARAKKSIQRMLEIV